MTGVLACISPTWKAWAVGFGETNRVGILLSKHQASKGSIVAKAFTSLLPVSGNSLQGVLRELLSEPKSFSVAFVHTRRATQPGTHWSHIAPPLFWLLCFSRSNVWEIPRLHHSPNSLFISTGKKATGLEGQKILKEFEAQGYNLFISLTEGILRSNSQNTDDSLESHIFNPFITCILLIGHCLFFHIILITFSYTSC